MPPISLLKPRTSVIAAILAVGVAICALICWSALRTNGAFGFPLDDPWIHLQFARNFRDYGSFSYFRNEMVTSGSTSPLYTLLLAAGFLVTSNEMLLSYALGIAFFTAGGFFLSRVGDGLFKSRPILMVAAVALYLLEPRLQWAALSGMETTLFLCLLFAVWYFYRIRSARWLGVTAGLLLWTRPEAIIFLATLALDVAYQARWVRRPPVRKKSPSPVPVDNRWILTALLIAAIIGIGYAAFNFFLSGSFLPNTYAAKTRYYNSGGEGFPAAVFHFLTSGHMPVLACLVSIAVIEVLWKVVKRAGQDYLVPVFWSAALFLAYWHKLPFLYQEGRYLMPILPFIILLGLRGAELVLLAGKKAVTALGNRAADTGFTAGISLLLAAQFVIASWKMGKEYATECKYINDRQVRTAHWITEHTPADAIIGTHDVGAIAFYSGRRIVDMVGLVSPGMIDNIGSFDRLKGFLTRNHVTHLAVLRNWFEVANQNPLFQTDERTPEIMEVFAYDPSRTHFTPQNAGSLASEGIYYLSMGQVQRAGPLLQQSIRLDPQSARARCFLGLALLSAGNSADAEREIRTALTLQPDSWQSSLALARVHLARNDPNHALAVYNEVAQKFPGCAPVYQELSQFYRGIGKDSVLARRYAEKYVELSQESSSQSSVTNPR
jgi:tetratricopeptide (TPR) repeat protein